MFFQRRSGKKLAGFVGIFFLGAVVMPPEGHAHFRDYVWNEVYRSLPQGGFEVEGWTTMKVPHHDISNENTFEYQTELEYGVTDHLTIAHYERFQTVNQAGDDDVTQYSGFKFETKYRLAEKGKWWVDPLHYLEWATDPRDHDNPNAIEGKVVLSKDLGKFNMTYNQIMESALGDGGRTEHEFTAGMNCAVLEDLKLGMEIKGQYWHPSSNRNELAMGPTVSYETKWFWVSWGTLFGLNHEGDDVQSRIIVGVPF